jgi:Electron transfer DM13
MLETSNRFPKRRIVLAVLALVLIFGLWYAFRPEKLFVNKKVDEAPPATLTQMTPLYTGSFHSNAHETSGRATIYQQPNGSRVLTLSNFATANEAGLEVLLLDGAIPVDGQHFTPSDTNHRNLGEIKAGQGEQSYALFGEIDFNRFNTVAIYSAGLHSIFGTAKLDAF